MGLRFKVGDLALMARPAWNCEWTFIGHIVEVHAVGPFKARHRGSSIDRECLNTYDCDYEVRSVFDGGKSGFVLDSQLDPLPGDESQVKTTRKQEISA